MTSNAWKWIIAFGVMAHFSYKRDIFIYGLDQWKNKHESYSDVAYDSPEYQQASYEDVAYDFEDVVYPDADVGKGILSWNPNPVHDSIDEVDYNQNPSSKISLTSNTRSLWTSCSKTCGGGLQKMKKWVKISATNGGSQEFNFPHPIRTCNKKPCGKMAYTNL